MQTLVPKLQEEQHNVEQAAKAEHPLTYHPQPPTPPNLQTVCPPHLAHLQGEKLRAEEAARVESLPLTPDSPNFSTINPNNQEEKHRAEQAAKAARRKL